MCCLRCPQEADLGLDLHCLGFASISRSMSLSWDWKSPPIPLLCWVAESHRGKRFEDCKKERGPLLHPDRTGCEGPWWQFLPSFVSLCHWEGHIRICWIVLVFSEPCGCFREHYYCILACEERKYGRGQFIRVSCFIHISVISSNPVAKAQTTLRSSKCPYASLIMPRPSTSKS